MRESIAKWLGEKAISGAIAIGTIGVASYITIQGQEVPEWLVGTVGMVVAFYFNRETQRRAQG